MRTNLVNLQTTRKYTKKNRYRKCISVARVCLLLLCSGVCIRSATLTALFCKELAISPVVSFLLPVPRRPICVSWDWGEASVARKFSAGKESLLFSSHHRNCLCAPPPWPKSENRRKKDALSTWLAKNKIQDYLTCITVKHFISESARIKITQKKVITP